jgi:hypothetical protein
MIFGFWYDYDSYALHQLFPHAFSFVHVNNRQVFGGYNQMQY